MIPNLSKFAFTAAAVLLVTSSAAFAEHRIKRIDHPNGGPTFVRVEDNRPATVAVYVNGQGIGRQNSTEVDRPENRKVRIRQGRGQQIDVRSASR